MTNYMTMTSEDWDEYEKVTSINPYAESVLEEIRPTIVVFGGSSGISKTISPYLQRTYDVVLLSSKDCNIEDESVVKSVLDKYKPPIVMSFVGINDNSMLHKTISDSCKTQVDIMILGHLNILRNALSYMRERNFGRIIFASSVLSKKFVPGTCLYSTCKAAIERIVFQAARENGNKGITANTLGLGYFDTGLIKDVPQEMLDKIKQTIPSGKLGESKQLAQIIDTIINCPYINGTNLQVDGGIW